MDYYYYYKTGWQMSGLCDCIMQCNELTVCVCVCAITLENIFQCAALFKEIGIQKVCDVWRRSKTYTRMRQYSPCIGCRNVMIAMQTHNDQNRFRSIFTCFVSAQRMAIVSETEQTLTVPSRNVSTRPEFPMQMLCMLCLISLLHYAQRNRELMYCVLYSGKLTRD